MTQVQVPFPVYMMGLLGSSYQQPHTGKYEDSWQQSRSLFHSFHTIHFSNCSLFFTVKRQDDAWIQKRLCAAQGKLRDGAVSHSFHRLMSSLRAWQSFKSDLVS